MKIYVEQILFLIAIIISIVSADKFISVFESKEDAIYCSNKNYAYMNKISTNIQQDGSEILLSLKNNCNPVISEEFEAVCENVKESHCIYDSN